jgi:hypothetical protein
MAAPDRKQALTAIIPVSDGASDAVDAFLEAWRELIVERLAALGSLHTAQVALLPPPDLADSTLGFRSFLLFETTFDGGLTTHLAEWWWLLAEELDGLLSHCEGWTSPSDEHGFSRYLRNWERSASVWGSAHPGLSVSRIQADARLRATVGRHLREERALLRGQAPLAVVKHVRYLLERDAEREDFDFAVIEPPSTPAAVHSLRQQIWDVARADGVELLHTLTRSLGTEFADLLAALWNDTKLDSKGLDARLERCERLEHAARQNAFLHLVEAKPGLGRRRALRFGLRFLQQLLQRVPALAARMRSGFGHSSRWVLLEDGRLLFSNVHDGTLEAYLGEVVERASACVNLIWSNTRHFPTTLGFCLGGARREQSFKTWARTGQVVAPIWYSAYPTLAVRDVLVAAELRELFARELEPASAARVLELV